MDKSNDMMGGPSANNSSDFVRKLYKMLEDPSHEAIVRWGEGGQSFVVLENEKFTKQILPKHFKHSNFASFVRQLNKYDFHKVRQNNEDNIPSPYGPNAWEFKHPEFQADKKDSLDNIRRKAPAPRKPTQGPEDAGYPVQQMDLLNNQFLASQQQLNLLTAKYEDLAQGHVVLLQQVVQLQKFVKAHDGVMHKVMGFLHNVDNEQRRNSRVGGPFANGPGPGMPGGPSNDGDHPASPLQQASELLERFPVETLSDTELTKMEGQLRRADYSTPPSDQTAPNMGATSAPSANTHINYSIGNDIDNIDNMVYPVGHTNGIDPVHSEHINNIPYALPANGMLHVEPMPEMVPDIGDSGQKKSSADSPWGMNKPRILLVEDDKVCARIGSKFLQAFECGVETARDGLEAVNKINNQVGTTFDLILMDIIMPHLDGVSATVCIREIRPHIPIIAMTSNIRADDIDMYFRYGMNDVLPKPFTKEGMLRALEKNLPQFRKTQQFPNQTQAPNPGTFVTPSQTQVPLLNMGPISAAQSLKEETSPGKSPVTASSWHSPNQLPSTSPVNAQGNYGNYTMTPTHQQQQQHHPFAQSGYAPQNPGMGVPLGGPRTGPHRRMVSDMTSPPGPDDHPDPKRQRMYPPPQGSFAQ